MFNHETVRYVSTIAIPPCIQAEPTKVDIIDLNPWDLKMLPFRYMQRGFLFTDNKHHQEEKPVDVMNHLKNSLTKTLEYFYPLAGRLAIRKHEDADEETSISMYIDCKNSTGAEFVSSIADITVSDVLDSFFADPCVVHECFFPLNGALSHEGQSLPLLSVQVTKLIDGIFIGCSMNHTVCDGTSFWHFIASWAEISKGAINLDRPVLERCFFDTDSPIRIPISTFQLLPKRFPGNTSPLEERIFHFEQEGIARLKTKANLEISVTESGTTSVSSLQALFAHIWLATTRARRIDRNEETSFWLTIGNRSRMTPPLPEAYFGNSLQHGVATAKAGELLEKGLGWAALLLNQVIVSYDDEKVLSIWKSWVVNPSFMFTGNSPPPKNILVSGGSPRFNVYDNDFGWGKPVAVRTGRSSHYDGRIFPSGGLVEGSIDLEVCLSCEIMKTVEDDKEFMDPVTISYPPSFKEPICY